jgi:hypothetical protein
MKMLYNLPVLAFGVNQIFNNILNFVFGTEEKNSSSPFPPGILQKATKG